MDYWIEIVSTFDLATLRAKLILIRAAASGWNALPRLNRFARFISSSWFDGNGKGAWIFGSTVFTSLSRSESAAGGLAVTPWQYQQSKQFSYP